MTYQNKRNGEIVTVVETNEKFKTVIVELADGSTKTITSATLKRWYVEIESPEVVEPLIDLDNPVTETEAEAAGMVGGDEAVELAVPDPDVAGDGTPLAEVGKEIALQAAKKAKKTRKKVKAEKPAEADIIAGAKQSTDALISEIMAAKKKAGVKIMDLDPSKVEIVKEAPKAKKSKKAKVEQPKVDIKPVVDWICGKAEALGAEVFTPDKAPNVRAFKLNGHMFARLNISRKQVTLCCRSAAVESVNVPVDKQQKHMFDVCFVYTDLKSKGIIAKLLEVSYQFQLDKKAGKEVK